MLTLFIAAALSTVPNPTNNETISFFGVIPSPTCNLDSYPNLEQIDGQIRCPDSKEVIIKKDNVLLPGSVIQDVWVIEYGKEK